MSTLYQVHSISGVVIYYDSYRCSCYICPENTVTMDAATYDQIRKWCFANRHILVLLDAYAHSGNSWSPNFCSEEDAEIILSSPLVGEALKEEFRQFLEDPFFYKSKGVKKKFPREKGGFVYVLKCGPHYKIGLSQNVGRRVRQLSTTPPFDVELIHAIKTDDAHGLESSLHNRFSEKRKHGEWFELDQADVEYLKELGAQDG